MSDNKKYYYLKLKDNFYDSDEIKILEGMSNGYKYTTLLLKLYLRSIKNGGKLTVNDFIPYDNKMIAAVTNMDLDTVMVAMEMFKNLKLVEVLENGTIYMLNIQNYIGESSTEADRIREYRNLISEQKKNLLTSNNQNVQMYNKRTPEIELEKEIKIELEKELEKEIKIELEKDILDTTKVICSSKLQPVVDKWNSLNLSKLLNIKGTRLKLLNARIKEYGLEEVLKAIDNINCSSFLKGQNNRSWVITFDWFVKPNNFTKVSENNYSDKEGNRGSIKQNNESSSAADYDFSKYTG